jgi:hypothetical protein
VPKEDGEIEGSVEWSENVNYGKHEVLRVDAEDDLSALKDIYRCIRQVTDEIGLSMQIIERIKWTEEVNHLILSESNVKFLPIILSMLLG